MKILVAGDSFAADWSPKYPNGRGWPNLLADRFDVTNLAQAGVGEYKILQQLKTVDLHCFDLIIISHTSPYRVHTRRHPVHSEDILHCDSDLCISDISYHAGFFQRLVNPRLWSAYRFFLDHFDDKYQEEIYLLLRAKIQQSLSEIRSIVINHNIAIGNKDTASETLDISGLQKTNPGLHNHLDAIGNHMVFKQLCSMIDG